MIDRRNFEKGKIGSLSENEIIIGWLMVKVKDKKNNIDFGIMTG